MNLTKKRFPGSEQGTKEMLPVIFSLAWPTMLEQLMQTAVQYMDTGMVGVLGTSATAAVGATSTVNWLIGSTISAISVGFLAYISQAMGAGRKEQARKASGQAVMTVLIVGILFTLLTMGLSSKVPVWMQVDPSIRKMAASYFLILYSPMLFRTANIIFGTVLRAVGDTKTPMQVGVAFNIINIVLNFFLIYSTRTISVCGKTLVIPGAGWGVQGAAAASAIAYTIGGIAITYKLWKHVEISPKGQSFLPDAAVLRPCLKVAIPNMFQRFATSLGYVAFASMINSLGETATAAHTIANTVESAFYIPGYGMQTAAATLAGNALGANDNKKLNSLAKAILPLEVGLMIISGSLLFIFAPVLIRLFSSDIQVIRLGSTVLRMVAVSEPFYGVPIVIEGMMQGVGKTVTPFVFNVAGMWGVRILGTFLCIHLLGMGLISAWACMIGHNMLLFVLFTMHYISGKWNPMNKQKAQA
ncbi:MATE family efflux transporter [Blautia sp. HCP3S3_H10_1]|uniref:MATE family efflux transporter n=1 Tax=unclassified Blautia TaxID=2648079 RepID=UPI003F8FC660|nr:MATE family efflux transporter [Clostridia bacterium]